MKTAIIGLGVIANVHIEALKTIDATLTCVCEADEARAMCFLNSHGINNCKIYTDYKKMLKEEQIDVVHICTPHFLHEEMCVFALENNVNVLCEKPLCITEDGIERIIEAQERSSAQLAVCLQNRYNESNLYVKKLLEGEKIKGGYATVKWLRTKEYYQSGEWRGKKETEGGGVLINQALHTIDLVQWLCGMPNSLKADVYNEAHSYIEVEDTAKATLMLDSGVFDFYASISSDKDYPVTISIETETKKITVVGNKVIVNGEEIIFDDPVTQTVKACYGNSHPKLFAHFYASIKNGEKFPIDAKEGAKVVKLILAMYNSNGDSITL